MEMKMEILYYMASIRLSQAKNKKPSCRYDSRP